MDNRAQNITLTIGDGRTICATVPVFWELGEATPTLTNIKVSHPYNLPIGQSWEVFNAKEATDGKSKR